MISHDLWIIIVACLTGVSCALVGVFLVLRKLAMVGDAISHSVLFGIVVVFLLVASRAALPMLIGAGAVGLLTVVITSVLHRVGKLQEDASIGVAFTWLFALGVILISAYAGKVDLDQDCVLFGEIAFTPFDTVSLWSGVEIPRAALILLAVLVLNIALIVLGYRALKVLSFDPVLASSLGIATTFWHYALMTCVSVTTVAAFESVGAILVVAMLVVPANAAFLIARGLGEMLCMSAIFALISAVTGYYVAEALNTSISASIALVSGGILLLNLLIFGDDSVFRRLAVVLKHSSPAR